ncbi:hypothetical protein ACFT1A_01020 [Rhodococcus sp. NPDC057135]|uniref:hypothetical protein n=1 Tax=Rhodococcus sp. NPDC057135 TaxID=3346028 RepID=UPI00362F42A0
MSLVACASMFGVSACGTWDADGGGTSQEAVSAFANFVPNELSPSWDVFESWKIQPFDYLSGSSNPLGNGGSGIPPGCQDLWLQQFPERIYEAPTEQLRRQPKDFVAPVTPLGVQYRGGSVRRSASNVLKV